MLRGLFVTSLSLYSFPAGKEWHHYRLSTTHDVSRSHRDTRTQPRSPTFSSRHAFSLDALLRPPGSAALSRLSLAASWCPWPLSPRLWHPLSHTLTPRRAVSTRAHTSQTGDRRQTPARSSRAGERGPSFASVRDWRRSRAKFSRVRGSHAYSPCAREDVVAQYYLFNCDCFTKIFIGSL